MSDFVACAVLNLYDRFVTKLSFDRLLFLYFGDKCSLMLTRSQQQLQHSQS